LDLPYNNNNILSATYGEAPLANEVGEGPGVRAVRA